MRGGGDAVLCCYPGVCLQIDGGSASLPSLSYHSLAFLRRALIGERVHSVAPFRIYAKNIEIKLR